MASEFLDELVQIREKIVAERRRTASLLNGFAVIDAELAEPLIKYQQVLAAIQEAMVDEQRAAGRAKMLDQGG